MAEAAQQQPNPGIPCRANAVPATRKRKGIEPKKVATVVAVPVRAMESPLPKFRANDLAAQSKRLECLVQFVDEKGNDDGDPAKVKIKEIRGLDTSQIRGKGKCKLCGKLSRPRHRESILPHLRCFQDGKPVMVQQKFVHGDKEVVLLGKMMEILYHPKEGPSLTLWSSAAGLNKATLEFLLGNKVVKKEPGTAAAADVSSDESAPSKEKRKRLLRAPCRPQQPRQTALARKKTLERARQAMKKSSDLRSQIRPDPNAAPTTILGGDEGTNDIRIVDSRPDAMIPRAPPRECAMDPQAVAATQRLLMSLESQEEHRNSCDGPRRPRGPRGPAIPLPRPAPAVAVCSRESGNTNAGIALARQQAAIAAEDARLNTLARQFQLKSFARNLAKRLGLPYMIPQQILLTKWSLACMREPKTIKIDFGRAQYKICAFHQMDYRSTCWQTYYIVAANGVCFFEADTYTATLHAMMEEQRTHTILTCLATPPIRGGSIPEFLASIGPHDVPREDRHTQALCEFEAIIAKGWGPATAPASKKQTPSPGEHDE